MLSSSTLALIPFLRIRSILEKSQFIQKRLKLCKALCLFLSRMETRKAFSSRENAKDRSPVAVVTKAVISVTPYSAKE